MSKFSIKRLRKAADGGNIALIALAVGAIIIIGMYIFTSTIGSKMGDSGDDLGTALTGTNDKIVTPTSSAP